MPKKLSQERIEWVEDALFKFGMTRAWIVREGMKRWGVKQRMVDHYLARARKHWAETNPHDLIAIRAELDGMARHVYGQALAEGDLKAANAAIHQISELHGAAQAQRIQLETQHTVSVDSAQLKDDIRQFLAADPNNLARLLGDGESGEAIEIAVIEDVAPKNGKNGANGSGTPLG